MQDPKKRIKKAQERQKKKNLKKANRYERAASRKADKAQKKEMTSGGDSKKRGKALRKMQEAKNFASEASKVKKRKGSYQPKSRAKLQVTKKSASRKLAEKSPAYKYSSGGRKYASKKKR